MYKINVISEALPTTSSLALVDTKSRVNTSPPIPPIVSRLMHGILMASLFVIISVLVPSGTAYAAAVKWHPGHYLAISKDRGSRYTDKVYRQIKATPALRGAQIRYKWSELEKSKGVYDFKSIDKKLADMKKMGKRLIIVVQHKSFKPHVNPAPSYLKAGEYDGGTFPYSQGKKKKGYNLKLWNDKVRFRMEQLVIAMGKRYNSHPNFEGIGIEETAMGKPMIKVSDVQVEEFYKNLLAVNKKMRSAFPNTMTFQMTNDPRSILKWFVPSLKNMGASLGGPDVRIQDEGLNEKGTRWTDPGAYSYYPKLSGIVPLTPSVMTNNYRNTKRDGSGYKPTVQQLLNFARDELKANYIMWTWTSKEHQELLQVLNFSKQRKSPSGGLNARCPSKYGSCKK